MKNIDKFGKILYVGMANKYYCSYQHYYLVLKKLAREFICFDYRLVNLQYGKEEMNRRLLEVIEKEKPDFIYFAYIVDDFYIDTLLKIREISPKSITLTFFGDDDCYYEPYSRYYKLLIDYILVMQKNYMHLYKKEGRDNAFFTLMFNPDSFYPLKTEKKYDISFAGIPESDRYEYLKYLIDNGINVKIFGRGWDVYPELKKYYGGILTHEELVKAINETKITICFSKNMFGVPHLKGRVFETASCKSFMLVEYLREFTEIFKEGKEIVMFKNKEDLLKKIKYYLEHPKEREEIADRIYKKVKKEIGFYHDLKKFFTKHYKKNHVHIPLPITNKKILEISKKEINLPFEKLKEKIKDYDYVCFNDNILKKDLHKEYFQIYSLEKSGKEISCCNCYIGNKKIGNSLYYSGYFAFHKNKSDFYKMLSINQLATTKEFLLNNLETFKKAFNKEEINILTEENTVFIEIPLLEINRIKHVSYKNMKSYFVPKFLYKLYSLKHQNQLYKDPYIYNLFFDIIKGNYFLLWLLLDSMKNPYYKQKQNELKGQIEEQNEE